MKLYAYGSLRLEMFDFLAIKKPVGKTKEELALEKKRELEKRLQDVSGQLNSTKKPPKKGEYPVSYYKLTTSPSLDSFLDKWRSDLYSFNLQPCSAASEKTESSSAQQVAVSRLSASSSSSDSSSSSSSSSSSDTSDSDSG